MPTAIDLILKYLPTAIKSVEFASKWIDTLVAAKNEGRDLTPEEIAELDALMEQEEARFEANLAKAKANLAAPGPSSE